MKLRYQMRGLGIGMIVTALLMGLTAEKVPLSDAEIKALAMELGMVESDSLKLTDVLHPTMPEESEPSETDVRGEEDLPSDADASGDGTEPGSESVPEGEAESGSESVPGGEAEPGSESVPGGEAEPGSDSVPEGEAESGPESVPGGEAEPDAESGAGNEGGSDTDITGDDAGAGSEKVTIVIEPGISSYRICIMLAEAGLVEDAAEFDTYLCDNGYSRKIDSGTYEIPVGISEEEIAKIITRNR